MSSTAGLYYNTFVFSVRKTTVSLTTRSKSVICSAGSLQATDSAPVVALLAGSASEEGSSSAAAEQPCHDIVVCGVTRESRDVQMDPSRGVTEETPLGLAMV